MENRKLWFKARKYGYGWTPAAWQGWVVLGLYLIVIFFGLSFVLDDPQNSSNLWAYWAWVAIATAAFLFVCAAKGEKPAWHWGGKTAKKVEMLDELDEKGVKTGRSFSRKEIHEKGIWHRTVHVFIINSKKEVLLQLRAKMTATNPSKWHLSSGGHIESGQNSLEAARRETIEEIGLDIPLSEFISLGSCKIERPATTGTYRDNEYCDVYLVRKDIEISKFKKQDSEVADLKWVPMEEFMSAIKSHDEKYVNAISLPCVFEYYEKNIR